MLAGDKIGILASAELLFIDEFSEVAWSMSGCAISDVSLLEWRRIDSRATKRMVGGCSCMTMRCLAAWRGWREGAE